MLDMNNDSTNVRDEIVWFDVRAVVVDQPVRADIAALRR